MSTMNYLCEVAITAALEGDDFANMSSSFSSVDWVNKRTNCFENYFNQEIIFNISSNLPGDYRRYAELTESRYRLISGDVGVATSPGSFDVFYRIFRDIPKETVDYVVSEAVKDVVVKPKNPAEDDTLTNYLFSNNISHYSEYLGDDSFGYVIKKGYLPLVYASKIDIIVCE